MDSEYEDYNIDKMLEEMSSNTPSDNAYKFVVACVNNKDMLKSFIEVNLNTPLYNKFYKYYAEVIGYNDDKIPVIIIGITKRDESVHHSIWNTFGEKDVIMVKDLDKFIGYKYAGMYDIIDAIEGRNNQFCLRFLI
jgi:hypothetical protein